MGKASSKVILAVDPGVTTGVYLVMPRVVAERLSDWMGAHQEHETLPAELVETLIELQGLLG